jgi:hypothetical protein
MPLNNSSFSNAAWKKKDYGIKTSDLRPPGGEFRMRNEEYVRFARFKVYASRYKV